MAKKNSVAGPAGVVRRHRLLSREEERSLLVAMKNGDQAARDRLIELNQRRVNNVVAKLYKPDAPGWGDAVSEGNAGLMKALDKFDLSRGTRLGTYAQYWIRAYVWRYFNRTKKLVDVNYRADGLAHRVGRCQADMAKSQGETSWQEALDQAGLNDNEAALASQAAAITMVSLDRTVDDEEGNQVTYGSLLPSDGPAADDACADDERRQLVAERLAVLRQELTARDQAILDERLMADDPMSLQELGDRFGVSRERIRQLEERLMGRLREVLTEID